METPFQMFSSVVTSPDKPGLVTEGNSLAESVLNAYEAAGLLLNDHKFVEMK